MPKKNTPSNLSAFPNRESGYSAEWSKSHNVLGTRLREARTLHKMSLQELSDRLQRYDIHMRGATISKWELGLSIPTPYQVFALCHILGIQDPLTYFAGGPADCTELNDEGLRKLRDYRTDLVRSGRYTVRMEEAAEEPEPEEEQSLVPCFDIAAAAGFGDDLDEGHFEYKPFPTGSVPTGTDFVVRITGDSMTPRYRDGQYAFIKRCEELNPGEIGIFAVDGMAYIKKYTEQMPDADELQDYANSDGVVRPKIRLISLNPKYKPIQISPDSTFCIYGRVLNHEGWNS